MLSFCCSSLVPDFADFGSINRECWCNINHWFYQRSQFLSSCSCLMIFLIVSHFTLGIGALFLLSILYHSLLPSLYAIACKLTIISFPQQSTWMALYSLNMLMCRLETTHSLTPYILPGPACPPVLLVISLTEGLVRTYGLFVKLLPCGAGIKHCGVPTYRITNLLLLQ